MIIQDTRSEETNETGANVELNAQMQTCCQQIGRELRCLGDSLENLFLRPLHVAVQNHERVQIEENLMDVARIVVLRCVTELLGLNN